MKIAHIMPLRTTVRVLINRRYIDERGMQARVASEYGVTRQGVGQVVGEERRKVGA
jgi:hypothetical protein